MTPNLEEKNEVTEPVLIEEDEATVLNKKTAAVTSAFFKAMTMLSAEEIYLLAFTPAGQNSPRLLEVVNAAYSEMLAAGGDIPRVYFNNYKKIVANFNETLVFNIESKLEDNEKSLIMKATGKTEFPDKISHQDIIDALTN